MIFWVQKVTWFRCSSWSCPSPRRCRRRCRCRWSYPCSWSRRNRRQSRYRWTPNRRRGGRLQVKVWVSLKIDLLWQWIDFLMRLTDWLIFDLLVALTTISLTSALSTARRVAPMPSQVSAAMYLLRVSIQEYGYFNTNLIAICKLMILLLNH